MPWLFIPVLLLTSVIYYGSVILGFGFHTLFLPLAAWLGYRHGTKGLAAVAIACVILIFHYSIHFDAAGLGRVHFGQFRGMPLAGIGLAWLCAGHENWRRVGHALKEHTGAIWMMLLFPIVVKVSLGDTKHSFGSERISFDLGDGQLAYAAIFAFGFLGGRFRQIWLPLMVMLSLSVAVGIINDHLWEHYVERSQAGQWLLNIYYAYSNNLFESILFLFTGIWTSNYLSSRTKPFERYRYGFPVLFAALVVISYFEFSIHKGYDPGAFFQVASGFHPIGHLEIPLIGDGFTFVIAAFLFGLVYGNRGYLIVSGVVIGYAVFINYVGSQFGGFHIAAGFEPIWQIRDRYTLWSLPALLAWVFVGDKTRRLYDEAKPRENSPHPARPGR